MKARDIMTAKVVTVPPTATVPDIAKLMVEHGISAVPVVAEGGTVIGIVSEGDLLRRKELGTGKHRSWWLQLLTSSDTLAREYTKSHALTARDVMTSPVLSVGEEMEVAAIADLLEEHRIKRVTVVKGGKLVGIVSRRDLIKTLARPADRHTQTDDRSIRNTLAQRLRSQPWAGATAINFIVENGAVEVYGAVDSDAQRQALRVMAETIPGVKAVRDRLITLPLTHTAV